MKWSKDAKKNGDYFPIWGACLGMEMVIVETCQLNPRFQYKKIISEINIPVDKSTDTVLIFTEEVNGALKLEKGPDWDDRY